ncbi:hypothetical protein Peur_046475 [Populus x canadensis]
MTKPRIIGEPIASKSCDFETVSEMALQGTTQKCITTKVFTWLATIERNRPLLDLDLLSSGTGLCCHELVEVADGVIVVALHSQWKVSRWKS